MIYAVLALAKDTHRRTRASDIDTSRKSNTSYDTISTLAENNARKHPNNAATADDRIPQTGLGIAGSFVVHSCKGNDDGRLSGTLSAGQKPLRSKAAQKWKASLSPDAQETGSSTAGSPTRKKARNSMRPASNSTSPRIGVTTRSRSSTPEVAVRTTSTITKPVSQSQTPNTETNNTNRMAASLSGRQKQLAQAAVNKFQGRLQPERHRVFNIDYDQPFFNVCKQFLDFTLPKTKDLDILCRPWAPEPNDFGERFSLPSWIPSLSGVAFGK